MKKFAVILLLTVLLGSACGRDAQANAFIKEYSDVADQIVERLGDNDLDGAREVLDENQSDLKKKWNGFRTALPFQFSDATRKKMKSEPEKDVARVVEAANEYIKKNPADEAKAQALALELADVFR